MKNLIDAKIDALIKRKIYKNKKELLLLGALNRLHVLASAAKQFQTPE